MHQLEEQFFMTHPFICDNLISSVLRWIEWWQVVVDFAVA